MGNCPLVLSSPFSCHVALPLPSSLPQQQLKVIPTSTTCTSCDDSDSNGFVSAKDDLDDEADWFAVSLYTRTSISTHAHSKIYLHTHAHTFIHTHSHKHSLHFTIYNTHTCRVIYKASRVFIAYCFSYCCIETCITLKFPVGAQFSYTTSHNRLYLSHTF